MKAIKYYIPVVGIFITFNGIVKDDLELSDSAFWLTAGWHGVTALPIFHLIIANLSYYF